MLILFFQFFSCYLHWLLQETAGHENEILALSNKKRLANSSSKVSIQNRPSKVFLSSSKQSNVIAPRSKKSLEDPIDKKNLSVKSLQKSVQFSSHFVESNTTSSAIQTFGNSRISTTSLNLSKNTSSSLKTITRVYSFFTHIPSIYFCQCAHFLRYHSVIFHWRNDLFEI